MITARITIALSSRAFPALIMLLCVPMTSVRSADPHWPCVQVLVPTVELAVYWPDPVEPDVLEKWKSNKGLSKLASALAELAQYTEQDMESVKQFADRYADNDKSEVLSVLAAKTLEAVNQRRSFYIKGIKKYTVQQDAMAGKVEDALNKLEEQNLSGTEKADLEENLKWQQRIFDQREKAIRLLCEQPVVLEETLSSILRDMSYHLP